MGAKLRKFIAVLATDYTDLHRWIQCSSGCSQKSPKKQFGV